MSVDDFTFVDIIEKKRVKLTLKTASYFGVVQRINSNRTLTLTDVVDVKDGRRFPGVKLFFGHEIVNVEFCGETNGNNNGDISITESEGMLNVEEFQPYKKTFTIFDNEDENDYVNFEVINEFNEKFGPAVMHIKKQHVIGVAADGVESFQHGRLCWLQIATKDRVYLFDILLLGAQAFKNGLSMILQSTRVLKVVHDCRGFASSLLAQFGVTLTNVFDTQVADVLCFYSDTGGFLPDRVGTLQEVVSEYLKVPSSRLSSLQMKTQPTKEERAMWYKRPCPLPLLKVMALAVIHLQPLRLVLLDTQMTDYLALVDSYLSNSHKDPGGVEHIAMNDVLELPRELRELEHKRRDRQRLAVQNFSVNQHGLLDRYNPLSQAPPLSTTLPITTPLSQTPPKATPPSTSLPITTPLSEALPKATPPPMTPPITTPLSQTPPQSTTLPITTPLYQTPPQSTTLPITTPLYQTLPITTPLLKTTPAGLEASWGRMPRIQADATNHVTHAEPPPITQAVGLLHIQAPTSSPQVTRVSSLQSTALTPPVVAPSPPPVVLGPAPPPAHLGPAPPPAHLGPAPPPAVLGPAPPLAVLGPAPPPAVLGPAPPPSVLCPAPPPSVLCPAPPPAAAPRPSSSPSGPGMKELILGIIGRGRPLGEGPQVPLAALPSLGRGFLFQIAPPSSPVPKDGFPPGASKDNQMSPSAMPRLAGDTAAPRDLSGAGVLRGHLPALGRGQFKPSVNPLSSTLSQSSASFRRA